MPLFLGHESILLKNQASVTILFHIYLAKHNYNYNYCTINIVKRK